MITNFFIIRVLVLIIGIIGTVMITPIIKIIELYYKLAEVTSLNDNIFAILSIFIVIVIFVLLLKKSDKYISIILFSSIYYFIIPMSIAQLMSYNSTDGQIAFVVFPIYIIASIGLFFILKYFDKAYK